MKSKRLSSSGAVSRRRFLQTSALAAGALTFGVPTLLARRQLEQQAEHRLDRRRAAKAASDTDNCNSENIVALCDVDTDALRRTAGKISEREVLSGLPQDVRRHG